MHVQNGNRSERQGWTRTSGMDTHIRDGHVRDGDGHVMQGWTRTSGMDTHVRDGDGHIMQGWTRQGWTRTVLKRIKKDDLEVKRVTYMKRRICYSISFSYKCLISSTCQLCSEPYKEPRILPCLHSFCGQSLHKEIERSGTKQSMECPTCQRSITIPEGGINAVPQNLHLGFEVQ